MACLLPTTSYYVDEWWEHFSLLTFDDAPTISLLLLSRIMR